MSNKNLEEYKHAYRFAYREDGMNKTIYKAEEFAEWWVNNDHGCRLGEYIDAFLFANSEDGMNKTIYKAEEFALAWCSKKENKLGGDNMSQLTISQGLAWMKTLKTRHNELVALRDRNSSERIRRWGETKDDVVEKPVYDVKELDKLVNKVSLEIRKLDDAIKTINTTTVLKDYVWNENVLGEVQ